MLYSFIEFPSFLFLSASRFMKISPRSIVALILAAIYMLIVMRPLAPLAMQSRDIKHPAITGQCSGDCAVCGCSPERSASHTCCCWQKKLREKRKAERQKACCLGKVKKAVYELSCDCPCNENSLPGMNGTASNEQIPYHFTTNLDYKSVEDILPGCRNRLKDRPGDPPDPPPKLPSPPSETYLS
jgi:hypothetical protein